MLSRIAASRRLRPQVIGATTIDEFRKYIERDAALERRFQPVHVNEPSEDETLQILHGLRDKYERHHKVGGGRQGRVRGSGLARPRSGAAAGTVWSKLSWMQ